MHRVGLYCACLVALGCRAAPTPEPASSPPPKQVSEEPAPQPDRSDREPRPDEPDELSLCDDSWWALTLPPPPADGPRATLKVGNNPGRGYRRGEPRGQCVRWGEAGEWFFEPGELEVAADPRRLQRWFVGSYPVLLLVVPGEELGVGFHACMNWEFHGPRFCPDPGPDEDRSCERAVVQLVDDQTRSARLRPIWTSDLHEDLYMEIIDTQTWPFEKIPKGTALWKLAGSCDRVTLVSERDRVGMVPGVGERWRVWVGADGRLTGALADP